MPLLCLADLKRQNSEFRFLVADQYDCRCHAPRDEPLIALDDLVAKGEQLEQSFATAQDVLSGETQYLRERRNFYCTFGDLFNDLIDYAAVQAGHPAQCVYGHKACEYYTKSAHPRGALGLAYIFTGLGFHATAAHWFGVVEKISRKVGPEDTEAQRLAEEAHAQLEHLAAAALTTDRDLSACPGFPVRDTPGLIPAFQGAAASPVATPHHAAVARPVPNPPVAPSAGSRAQVDPNSHNETFRHLEQLRREEREREQRIAQGLCLGCGHPLRMVDKVARRQKHKECG